MFIDFREKGRLRERERETLVVCLLYVPQPGTEPTMGMCPDHESNPQTFGVWDNAPTD